MRGRVGRGGGGRVWYAEGYLKIQSCAQHLPLQYTEISMLGGNNKRKQYKCLIIIFVMTMMMLVMMVISMNPNKGPSSKVYI